MGKRKRERGRRGATPETSGGEPEPPRPPAGPPPAGRMPAWVHLLVAAALVAATLLLYAGDVDLGWFVLDDASYVTSNPWIRGFTLTNLRHVLTEPWFTMYAPAQILSYTADHAWGGLDPRTFHRSSNLWAALAAVLVYATAVTLTGDALAAALAGVLFVAAPVHVEAMAWISSRKDLVSTAFALLAFLAHVRMCHRPAGRRLPAYLMALVAFAVAVGAKQSVAVLPAVLLAWDVMVERRAIARSLLDKLPYAVVAALTVIPTLHALPGTRTSPAPAELAGSLAANLWLLTGLGVHVLFRNPQDGAVAVLLGVASALAALALFLPLPLWRRFPALDRFLLAWVALAIVPALAAAVAARGGPGLHPVTDRYLLFASAPFTVLVAGRATALGRARGRRGAAVSTAVLLALAALTGARAHAYLGEWRDPRSVWFFATARSDDPDVHLYLATHVQEASDRMDAARTLPPDLPLLADALAPGSGRGARLAAEWRDGARGGEETRKLRAELRRTAWDELAKADRARGDRVMPHLYFRRGKLLLEDGEPARARAELETAYAQSQMHTWEQTRQEFAVQCHYAIGVTWWQEKDYPEALRWIRLADQEQDRYAGSWLPELKPQRQRLEGIVAAAASGG